MTEYVENLYKSIKYESREVLVSNINVFCVLCVVSYKQCKYDNCYFFVAFQEFSCCREIVKAKLFVIKIVTVLVLGYVNISVLFILLLVYTRGHVMGEG